MRHLIVVLLAFAFAAQNFSQTPIDTSILVGDVFILFDYDRWAIVADDSISVRSLVTESSNYPLTSFHITAHTDSDGSDIYNMILSQKRAEAVRNLLIGEGVDSSIIEVGFYGEAIPRSPNNTEVGKQKNRRARLSMFFDAKIVEIHGRVVDDSTGTGVPNARVKLHSKYLADSSFTDQGGEFSIIGPFNEVIGLDVVAKNYFFKTRMMRTTKTILEKSLEVPIPAAIEGKSFDLNRFFFVGNKAILLEKSLPEIDHLLQFMTLSQNSCIEIVGHVNYPNHPPADSNTFQFNLSVARSKLIYDLLSESGISKDRMLYVGKGNWDMLYPTARTEDKMQKNRRVEIIIRSCGEVETGRNDPLDESFNFYDP